MKSVKDYPVKYPFGYSKAYGGWHSGVDRSTPYGTPLIINKTKVGLTGNSGYVLPAPTPSRPKNGSHHHLSRVDTRGKLVNPKNTGFKLRSLMGRKPRVVYVGRDSRNGLNVRIKGWNGATFIHCHLSKVYVKVGQVIK